MNQESRNNINILKAKKRIFINIDLPLEVRGIVKDVQEQIKIKQVKLIRLENAHITLCFLGYLNDKEINEVKNILNKVVPTFNSFTAKLSNILFFPNIKKARIISLGIESGGELEKLQEEIQEKLLKLSFNLEGRKFKPHLTLTRIKGKIGQSELKNISNVHIDNKKWKVREINLMQSFLEKDGARHKVLKEYKFSA